MIHTEPYVFAIRWLHVAAMALLLGGALLLWGLGGRSRAHEPREHGRVLLVAAETYEWFFWAAIGLIVVTGVGNLGAFGGALAGPQTAWGAKLLAKLLAVLVFVLCSLPRTLLIIRLSSGEAPAVSRAGRTVLQYLYAGTAILLAIILGLAVSLAHG